MVRLVIAAFQRLPTALALATAVLGSPSPAVSAGAEPRPIEGAPVVDFRDGKLSVDARDADLADLLREIATRADFELTTTGQLGRRSAILTDVPLEEGLRRLLQGHELMLIYRPAGVRGAPRVVAAHVFAERAGGAPLPATASTAGTGALSDIYQLVRAGNDPSNVGKLTDFLSNSTDATVRSRAAWALGRIGAPSASAALLQAVNDQSPQVRSQVAYALRNLLGVQAIPALVGLLERDPDASVRLVAARNLGTLRDASAASALNAAASDADPMVRQEVTRALQRQGAKLP